MGLIYKIQHKENKKIYIGQTSVSLKYRLQKHREAAKTGTSHFYKAIRKYGWEAFEIQIVEDNISLELINEREKYWIAYYDSYKNGYNSTIGGEGARLTTDEEIINLWHQGKTITDITSVLHSNKDTIRSVLHDYGVTSEDIKYRSKEWLRRDYDSEEVLKLWNEGKTTREIREHFGGMGQGTLLGILDSAGITSDIRKRRKEKVIQQFDLKGNLLMTYNNAKEASQKLNISVDGIRKAANGGQKTSGGYIWKYVT